MLSQLGSHALQARDASLKPPSGSAIVEWLRDDFGRGSDRGHTVVFPHQTDACAQCSSWKVDIASVEMSLKRHEQQGGDMTLERQQSILDLKTAVKDLKDELAAHRKDAAKAQELYKERTSHARASYLQLMLAYAAYLEEKQACNDATLLDATSLIASASDFTFALDTDYQQDKLTPFWGKSPQPGPTYFFSKETNYVHILIAPALGDPDTAHPSRLQRCVYYIRSQESAGSKDCNDTVFTIFDFLAAPLAPTCAQPQLFRTGYDRDGRLLPDAAPAASPASETEGPGAGEEATALTETEAPVAADEASSSTLRCSELTASSLTQLVRKVVLHPAADLAVQQACNAALLAARHTILARLSQGTEVPATAITASDILLATRPHARTQSAAELPSNAVDDVLNALGVQTLVLVAHAYLLASAPQVLVRRLSHQMDRCAGTNMSQFTFGGFGLALAVDAIDVWGIDNMVVGHTKFAPDAGALQLANCYNSNDCFSRAHLLSYAARYGTAVAYDVSLLVDLHDNKLFSPVPSITKLRCFLLIADDGALELGEPAAPPAAPGIPGAAEGSKYYTTAAVTRAAHGLVARSIRRVLAETSPRDFGVASGKSFLPKTVASVRPVLCFVKEKEEDDLFLLVSAYSLYKNDAAGLELVSRAMSPAVNLRIVHF